MSLPGIGKLGISMGTDCRFSAECAETAITVWDTVRHLCKEGQDTWEENPKDEFLEELLGFLF